MEDISKQTPKIGKYHTGHPPPNNGKAGCLNCIIHQMDPLVDGQISQNTDKLSPRPLHPNSVLAKRMCQHQKVKEGTRGQGTEGRGKSTLGTLSFRDDREGRQ